MSLSKNASSVMPSGLRLWRSVIVDPWIKLSESDPHTDTLTYSVWVDEGDEGRVWGVTLHLAATQPRRACQQVRQQGKHLPFVNEVQHQVSQDWNQRCIHTIPTRCSVLGVDQLSVHAKQHSVQGRSKTGQSKIKGGEMWQICDEP